MATTNGSSETGTTTFPGQDWTVPLWLDGKQVTTEHTFDLVAPATGNTLYKTSSANVNDCNAAVAAAEKAFPAWSKTKPSFRRELLLKAADELVRRREELWQFANKEVASTENYFAFDFNDAVESLRSTAGLIGGAAQGFLPDILSEDRSAMVVKEPFGVVLAIAPWNCPCILGLRSFLGPLASMFLCKSRTDPDHPVRTDMLVVGNTVVVKASEKGPGSMWALVDIFHKVGLPAGCLNTITHHQGDGPEIVTTLVSHPTVRKINFTGSTAVGGIVASLAGKHLKPVLME